MDREKVGKRLFSAVCIFVLLQAWCFGRNVLPQSFAEGICDAAILATATLAVYLMCGWKKAALGFLASLAILAF